MINMYLNYSTSHIQRGYHCNIKHKIYNSTSPNGSNNVATVCPMFLRYWTWTSSIDSPDSCSLLLDGPAVSFLVWGSCSPGRFVHSLRYVARVSNQCGSPLCFPPWCFPLLGLHGPWPALDSHPLHEPLLCAAFAKWWANRLPKWWR